MLPHADYACVSFIDCVDIMWQLSFNVSNVTFLMPIATSVFLRFVCQMLITETSLMCQTIEDGFF